MSSGHAADAVHEAAGREFEAHRRFLWGLCYRMTGSAADADDLVQETFVRAIERPPRDITEGWRGWLARVATNLAIDTLRRRKRRGYVGPWLPSPIDTGEEASPPGHEIASTDASTEQRYDLIESVSMAFLLALERLTPRQRAVLILRDVFDYTVRETAAALDLTDANVKVTHHRARAAMKDYDGSRLPPTRDRQQRTAARLNEFLARLQSQDVAGVEAMLAEDVRALNDGGGEYHAARLPVAGRRNVARLLVGLAAKGAARSIAVRMLNGLPALAVEVPARPGFAPLFVFRIELSAGGDIAAVHTILASRKLVAVAGRST